jgi:exonuclease SbcC
MTEPTSPLDRLDEDTEASQQEESLREQVRQRQEEYSDDMEQTAREVEELGSRLNEEARAGKDAQQLEKDILNPSFEQFERRREQDEENLAEAMGALINLGRSFDERFRALEDYNEEENRIVEEAKQALEEAKSELEEARRTSQIGHLLSFQTKSSAIESCKAAVERCEKRLEEAKEERERRYRDRIQNASIEDTLDRFVYQVQQIVDLLDTSIQKSVETIERLETRQQKALETKEKAAAQMESLKQRRAELQSQLDAADEELEELESGTEAYSRKEDEIADLKNELEDVKGDLDVVTAIHQSKEKFAEQLKVHIESQKRTMNNLRSLKERCRSDTKEREQVYKSTVRIIQALQDQEVASQYEEAADEADQRSMEIAAAGAATSEDDRLERMQSQDERMEAIAEVRELFAEKMSQVHERDQEIQQALQDQYGIDREDVVSRGWRDGESSADTEEKKRSSGSSDIGDDEFGVLAG